MAPSSTNTDAAVFFDLDGTLVDTAPDMVATLQALQERQGLKPVDYAQGRAHVSNGALGLLRFGFPGVEGDMQQALHREYLELYTQVLCCRSALFSGLDDLLARLDDGGVPWGVVTNKPAQFTDALLEHLQLAHRSACTVSGDTLSTRKPDPEPLLHACKMAGVRPGDSIYVGDALRDIQAGRAAGMNTIAAAYGYIVEGDDPRGWGANRIAENTGELVQIVLKAVNLQS